MSTWYQRIYLDPHRITELDQLKPDALKFKKERANRLNISFSNKVTREDIIEMLLYHYKSLSRK